MREIRFRFWTPDGRMLEDHDGWVEDIGINYALHCSASYGYKIMQFTGRKSQNEKDIYEGDIVVVKGRKKTGEYITEVIYDGFGFTLKDNRTYVTDGRSLIAVIDVIGNIYQNPELITIKNK